MIRHEHHVKRRYIAAVLKIASESPDLSMLKADSNMNSKAVNHTTPTN